MMNNQTPTLHNLPTRYPNKRVNAINHLLPVIILVSPQMGENIGATARAMKNFNISELRIIAPRDGWPNEQARSMAVSAVNIIDNAKIYDNLENGIKDIDYLYATSATGRNMNKNYISSKILPQDYPNHLKVGIMFGRESCGLQNKEIIYANKIININTGDFGSLNIAQAVVIICYELFHSNEAHQKNHIKNEQKLATRGELEHFFDHLFSELNNKNFFKVPEKKLHMTQNIMNIFTRIDKLSHTELQTLRGIISTLSL
ncbi:RNA methyltransferase [Candidatus Tisiphia endosymbiont of Nemotelus uliginosus]|uniref:RNA methyltransferase n=1 Tax=Candidatus Tisiphia endosymbiont of Nemotelus uliginosus TaxID=3077926 RepID=UPI0035C8FA19